MLINIIINIIYSELKNAITKLIRNNIIIL